MSIKLEDCSYDLQERIKRQLAEDLARELDKKMCQSVAKLGSPQPQHDVSRPLDRHPPQQNRRPQGAPLVHVLFVRYGRRGLGGDSLAFAYKALRDAVAMDLLGGKVGELDDDPRVQWDYDQLKVGCGATGTQVLITKL